MSDEWLCAASILISAHGSPGAHKAGLIDMDSAAEANVYSA